MKLSESTKLALKDLLLLVIVLALIAYIAMLMGCSKAKAETPSLPPSPLDTTTYQGVDVFETVTKVYDCTTGHTWWVLEYVDRNAVGSRTCGQHQFVVLDTAGTEAHG